MVAKKASKGQSGNDTLLGFNTTGWVSVAKLEKKFKILKKKNTAYLYVKPENLKKSEFLQNLTETLNGWQIEVLKSSTAEWEVFQTELGECFVVNPYANVKQDKSHYGILNKSDYGNLRDLVGAQVQKIKQSRNETLVVVLDDCNEECQLGVVAGLEIGYYAFKATPGNLDLVISGVSKEVSSQGFQLGHSTNIARHLVNLPPADLNPASYGKFMSGLLDNMANMKVEVWDESRLKKEKMGLLLAVGQAGAETSRLVKISYRPKKSKLSRPLAFVGKGVTFDTGGLDIKPSSGMRLMKKDMGGSGSLAGLAWYVGAAQIDVACDIYLALAENAVSEKAMHPGDILTAANGKTVEIHNTDAEGRLVMADALHYASSRTGKDEPLAVFDTSTLTGAMRVALGTTIAGMCCNDDKIAELMQLCGHESGDLCWRMPLYDEYLVHLKSSFADISNCASIGFGGGLTAALFLKEFVNDKKWLHLDFMAWVDRPIGAMSEQGGNGQMVQSFVKFLQKVDENTFRE